MPERNPSKGLKFLLFVSLFLGIESFVRYFLWKFISYASLFSSSLASFFTERRFRVKIEGRLSFFGSKFNFLSKKDNNFNSEGLVISNNKRINQLNFKPFEYYYF